MTRRRVGQDVAATAVPKAEAAEVDPAAAKRVAAQRVQARRRVNRGPDDPEFEDPRTFDQWADDVLVVLPPWRPYAAMITILEHGRQGEAAAVAAVRAAVALAAQEQYDAYATLCAQPCRVPDAGRVVAAVRAEWRRLGLQETRPARQMAAERGTQ